MKISKEQLEKAVQVGKDAGGRDSLDSAVIRLTDGALIGELVEKVNAMPDREGLVQDLRRRIAAGEYDPAGDEIAEAMLRRAVADSLGD